MRKSKRRLLVSFPLFVFLLPVIFAIVSQTASGITLLHEFSGAFSRNDGRGPNGSLIVSDSTLYGMTYRGGGDAHNDTGVVFKMNADGTGYSHLHEFAWGAVDGMYPNGSLILSGSTLYGMTSAGGSHNKGVVFKVNTDGTGYGILHNFTGYTDDGATPWGSLTLSGSTLYGMTQEGGDHNDGVVFKLNTDGTDYGLLREFAGGDNDGRNPSGSLVVSGSTLYGMTEWGGNDDSGVVFK
ncbi:MAG: choice-of-anchor tandem repeat GloVer-containing protein, partial [Planctomycetota bacterium]